MHESYPSAFIEVVKIAMVSMGQSFNTRIQSIPKGRPRSESLAMIGLLGEKLSGFIAINCDQGFLHLSAPALIENEEEAKDWQRELVNSLIGNIKNRCLPLEVDFAMSAPQTIDKSAFSNFSMNHGPVVELHFSHANEYISVLLSMMFAADFSLAPKANTGNVAGQPGTGIVF